MESSATTLGAGTQAVWLSGRLAEVPAGLYGFLVVALVAGSAGGYSQTTWGWAALATLWLGAVVLLARERIELGALELVFAGGLALFGAWVAFSNLWTPSVPSTMREVQRELAYIGVVATGLLVVRANGVCPRGRIVQLVDAVGRVHPGQVVREQPGVAGVTGTSCPRSALDDRSDLRRRKSHPVLVLDLPPDLDDRFGAFVEQQRDTLWPGTLLMRELALLSLDKGQRAAQ